MILILQILVRLALLDNSDHLKNGILTDSTGHSGKHGHEFLEFEYSHGRLRYANNSNYRNDSLIRKESTSFAAIPCFSFVTWLLATCSVDWSSSSQGAQAHSRIQWNHKVISLAYTLIFLVTIVNREDDSNWPKKNIVGKQELEIRVGSDHISFEVYLFVSCLFNALT